MDDRRNDDGRYALQTVTEFQPIATRSMFWRPHYLDYVEKSGWMEHIPFAFWLIEAHRPRVLVELGTHAGTSYFAFCQAVERLGLDTRCFAVDTWKGDAHSGLYAESVFERVRAYNDAQYSGFSRLVRSTFDQALEHFSDHTVDLLHIDGLHTLEAVTHDFDSWADKLSDRAVVVMHDTNVRERGFEVFALFEKLKTRFPTFEFVHGHGLGVVATGPEQSESMRQLFAASGNPGAEREIRDVFARLGRACADTYSAGRAEQREKELGAQVEQHKKQLAEALQKVEKLSSEHSIRTRDLTDARSRLQGQVEQHALERGQLAERVSLLKEAREELKGSVQRLQAKSDGVRAELDTRVHDIDLLKRQASEAATRIQQSEAAMQARDAQLVLVAQEHERAVAGLQSQLAEASGKLRSAQTQHVEAQSLHLGQIAELKQALRAREAHLLATQTQHGDATQQAMAREQALQEQIAGLQQRLQAGEQEIVTRDQVLHGESMGLQQRLQAAEQLLATREQAHQKGIADLRRQLESSAQERVQKLEEENEKATQSIKDRFAETAKLTNRIVALERELESKVLAEASATEGHAKLTSRIVALEHQVETSSIAASAAETERHALGTALAQARTEGRRLRRALQLKVGELERLQQALETRDLHLRDLTASRSWRLTSALRRGGSSVAASPSPVDEVQLLRHSGLFDEAWYLRRYPDVAAGELDPVLHYLEFGAAELRDPGPGFSTAGYLQSNADVEDSGINPLRHFIEHGRQEGRLALGVS